MCHLGNVPDTIYEIEETRKRKKKLRNKREPSDEALYVLWKMVRSNELYTYEMFKDDLTTWFNNHATIYIHGR